MHLGSKGLKELKDAPPGAAWGRNTQDFENISIYFSTLHLCFSIYLHKRKTQVTTTGTASAIKCQNFPGMSSALGVIEVTRKNRDAERQQTLKQ